jgi:hypothetical protein
VLHVYARETTLPRFAGRADREEVRMKLRHLILMVVFAALAFGGTFTCSTHDDDSTTVIVHN